MYETTPTNSSGPDPEQTSDEVLFANEASVDESPSDTANETLAPTTRRGRMLRRIADMLQDINDNVQNRIEGAHDKADATDATVAARREKRAQHIDSAKSALRGVGYVALGATVKAGEALNPLVDEAKQGVGAIADAALTGADKAYFAGQAVKESFTSGIATAVERKNNIMTKFHAAKERKLQRIAKGFDTARQAVKNTSEQFGERYTRTKDRSIAMGQSALRNMYDTGEQTIANRNARN
ncbi:MAG: hypothetical protein ABIR91_01620 [Candidatus Saccharimonadales bacterium]